jgi:hypothetical protein
MNRKNGAMRPWEIRRCTIPELMIALDDDLETRGPPRGGVEMGDDERRIWIAWRRARTPEQQLACATGELSVQEQLVLALEWHKCQP